MKKVFGFVIVMALAGSLFAQQKSVAGSWNMSVQSMSMHLVLEQKGNEITGTLDNPHGGTIQLKGQFNGGKITFSGASDDHSIELSAAGDLKADGSLAGSLTTNIGDMMWTAARAQH
jgi:hypothetical protein